MSKPRRLPKNYTSEEFDDWCKEVERGESDASDFIVPVVLIVMGVILFFLLKH